MSIATIRSVVRGPCPRLTHLSLGLSYDGGAAPGTTETLLASRAEHGVPSLTELSIAYPESGADLLEGLARSPVLKRLRVLSITGDVFDDEARGLAILREHRVAFSTLEKLYLPLEDVMNVDDRELIAGVASNDEFEPFSPDRYRAI